LEQLRQTDVPSSEADIASTSMYTSESLAFYWMKEQNPQKGKVKKKLNNKEWLTSDSL